MARQTTTSEHEVDSSDSESASSSVVYDHEPFETFRVLVLELVQCLWSECSEQDTNIERMSGGGFNRIIGISRKQTEEDKGFRYVLRIPRFDAARLDRDVAVLQFVRELGGIPIPDIVAYDATPENKLGSPYMVQTRLPGIVLFSAFPDLNHSNKCRVASDLGHVFRRMLTAKSEVAGLFTIPSNTSRSEMKSNQIVIEPFFEPEDSASSKNGPMSSTQDLLNTTFEARKATGLKKHPMDTLRPTIFDQFVTMAAELDADGWFEGNQFSLCHLDLASRNILVDPTTQSPKSIITGILDWDSAVLAPSFMSCAPPLWIWAWKDDEDEDERTANDTPPTEECKALKSTFEQAAGPLYIRYAYAPAYRLARRLLRFAIDGIRSSEDVDEAEAMLQEWSETRQRPEDAEKSST